MTHIIEQDNTKPKTYRTHVLQLHYQNSHDKLLNYILQSNLGRAKQDTLKAPHINTAKEIIKCFAQLCKKVEQIKIKPEKAILKLNNVMLGKATNQNPSTIYRHITRLIKHGVITNKIFHGSNSSYEIEINPEVLAVDYSIAYHQYVDKGVKMFLNNEDLTEEHKNIKNAVIPTFLNGIYYNIFSYIQASCNHIVYLKPLLETNNNKTLETVDKESEFLLSDNQSSKGSHKNSDDLNLLFHLKHGKTNEKKIKDRADFQAEILYNFMISALYAGKSSANYDVEYRSKNHIIKYLTSNFDEDTPLSLIGTRANIMMERILLTKRYIQRSPERFMPNADTWLDFDNENGFKGTLQWWIKTNEKRKQNKVYLKYTKDFVQIFNHYQKFQSLNTYLQCRQFLTKKYDKSLLDLFDVCVLKCNVTSNDLQMLKAV